MTFIDLESVPESFAPRVDHDSVRLRILGEDRGGAVVLGVLTVVAGLFTTALAGGEAAAMCGCCTLGLGLMSVIIGWQSLQTTQLVLTPTEIRFEQWVGPFSSRADVMALGDIRDVVVDDEGMSLRTVHIQPQEGAELAFIADGHLAPDVEWLQVLLIELATRAAMGGVVEQPDPPDELLDLVDR